MNGLDASRKVLVMDSRFFVFSLVFVGVVVLVASVFFPFGFIGFWFWGVFEVMMSETELRCWRDKECERLGSLVDIGSVMACRSVISIINAILGDD
jgi:hypothetical protein